MNLLLDGLITGLIMSLLTVGVYISFRIFRFPDLTAEGAVTLGAATSATILVNSWLPAYMVLPSAFAVGAIAGAFTGILHTKLKINILLAGLLSMTALFSINLHIMGKSSLSLIGSATCYTQIETVMLNIGVGKQFNVLGWAVQVRDIGGILLSAGIAFAAVVLFYWFFTTSMGGAMRTAGASPTMGKRLGINYDVMMITGLAISNGTISCFGSLLAQYQSFADMQIGVAMLPCGIACIVIGELFFPKRHGGALIGGIILGTLIFKMLLALLMNFGVSPNDLKLFTALFVVIGLTVATVRKKRHQKTPENGSC